MMKNADPPGADETQSGRLPGAKNKTHAAAPLLEQSDQGRCMAFQQDDDNQVMEDDLAAITILNSRRQFGSS